MTPYVLAIVGSLSLEGNDEAEQLIRNILTTRLAACPIAKVISGGARGIDSMVVTIAKGMGIPTEEFKPKRQAWLRDSPDGFWARNIKIAQECDELVRIVASDSRTYGSGWTRDLVRGMGKPTENFTIQVNDSRDEPQP